MAMRTYYVVQPFEIGSRGKLRPTEPILASSEEHAIRMAYRLEPKYAGVVAFARTADPDAGEYGDAVILVELGGSTDVDELMAA